MMTAAISELKARLSEYLNRVKAGEEILVTDRSVPVARLVPVKPATLGNDGLRELERQGLIKVGNGKLPAGFWKLPRGRDPRAAVRRSVLDEREKGW